MTRRPRTGKLELEVKDCPFNLDANQRIIVNHHVRTPVCIIKGLLEVNEFDFPESRGVMLFQKDYDTIKQELDELIGFAESVTKCSS
jgi:hypothetical protein